MQFTKTLLTLPASLVLASPTPRSAGVKSMMADQPQWTVESLKRTCDDADSKCDWSFRINTQTAGNATGCAYTVQGSPASHSNGALGKCGVFSITSGYSDQFGQDKAFTILSVADQAQQLMIWASYTEAQLEGGQIVSPDQSYAPAAIP